MTELAVMRWDPRSRAGAVAVSKKGSIDVKAVEALSKNVAEWAKYQSLAGEGDNAEAAPVQGTYDWRAYIQEEVQAARRRDESERKPRKAASPATPTSAPSVFYA